MRAPRWTPFAASPHALALGAFVLGACSTVAVQSAASEPPAEARPQNSETIAALPAPESPQPTVLPLPEAPMQISPNDMATIQHLARGQNAYLGRLVMKPGAAVPAHRDPTEEFIFVLEGQGTMTIEGETHEVEAGTAIYMPANAEVSFQNGDAQMIAVQVFAGPEPAAKYEAWAPVPQG